MKLLIIFLVWLFTFSSDEQIYVNLSKNEIVRLMETNNPGFDIDEGTVNKTYKYLKYVDKFNEETWLFFLSDNDKCQYTKLMSDYTNLNNRIKFLNDHYKKDGNLKWVYTDNEGSYTIELKKEEWYFTIVTRPKK